MWSPDHVHAGDGPRLVAQEGAYGASSADLPVLHYFPARGRAEPVRLALAAAGQEWFEPPVEPILSLYLYRSLLESYPFRQLPRFVDGRGERAVDIAQSTAILRHVARRFGLYGADDYERAFADMVVEAAAGDLRARLREAWFAARRGDAAAVERYCATVLAAEADLLASGAPGPGLACLERLVVAAGAAAEVKAHAAAAAAAGAAATAAAAPPPEEAPSSSSSGEPPWLGGASAMTIADIAVFDLVDSHLAPTAPRAFAAAVRARFPALLAHRARVAARPGVAAYLASGNRHAHVFGDEWVLEQRQQQQQGQQQQGQQQQGQQQQGQQQQGQQQQQQQEKKAVEEPQRRPEAQEPAAAGGGDGGRVE